MRLFAIDNRSVIIEPEVMAIAAFKALMDRDKNKDKSKAFKEFTYIYYYCDYKPSIASLPDKERNIEACKEAGLPIGYKPDDMVKTAIQKYLERKDSSQVLLLKAANTALYKIRRFYETFDLNEFDDKGKPIYNVKSILDSINTLDKTVTSISGLIKKVEMEESNVSSKQRGGGISGYYEDPDAQ